MREIRWVTNSTALKWKLRFGEYRNLLRVGEYRNLLRVGFEPRSTGLHNLSSEPP